MPDCTHRFLIGVELTEDTADDPEEQLRTREQIEHSLCSALQHSTAPEAIAEATGCVVAMALMPECHVGPRICLSDAFTTAAANRLPCADAGRDGVLDMDLLDKQIKTLCRLTDDVRLSEDQRQHCEGLFHMLSDLYAAIRPPEAT